MRQYTCFFIAPEYGCECDQHKSTHVSRKKGICILDLILV